VSEQTEGKIEDLIAPGLIDELTRLVLTNAIYFNAGWLFPFRPEARRMVLSISWTAARLPSR
jgi:serpin B